MATQSYLEDLTEISMPDIVSEPDVVRLANDGFAAIGSKNGQINGAIYDADANLIAHITGIGGSNGSIAQLANGNLVVASQDSDSILFTIVNGITGAVISSGVAQQATGRNADVSALLDGGFAIAYESGPIEASDICIDEYSSAGVHQASQVTDTTEPARNVALATLASGMLGLVYNVGDGIAYSAADPTVSGILSTQSLNRWAENAQIVATDVGARIIYTYFYIDDYWLDIRQKTARREVDSEGQVGISSPLGASGHLAIGDGRTIISGSDTTYIIFAANNAHAGVGADISAFFGTGKLVSFDVQGGILKGFARQGVERGTESRFTGTDWVDIVAGRFLSGGANNDVLTVNGNSQLVGGQASGDAGDDRLFGSMGSDTLDGGAGADTMSGGLGNDTYINPDFAEGDLIAENEGQGFDTIFSNKDIWLTDDLANVEAVILTGSADLRGSGNANSNVLTGNSGRNLLTGGLGSDTLDGGPGNDDMRGGPGDDRYVVSDPGDRVVESSSPAGGIDTVSVSIDYVLPTGVERLALLGSAVRGEGNPLANEITGNPLANLLKGWDGNDTIDASVGDDTVRGGNGNDTLVGGDGQDTLFGEDGSDTLSGGQGHDRLNGGEGADSLIGGPGSDTLRGGTGNDVYVADAADVVFEEESPIGGIDTLQIGISASLASLPTIENLVLLGTGATSGTGNAAPNIIQGTSGNNVLTGGGGNDTLMGGDGADRLIGQVGMDSLIGGAGDDIYFDPLLTGSVQDTIVESAGGGTDTVESSITSTLANAANVERLTLIGSAAIDGTGNSLSNLINGNGTANHLMGVAGADTLNGNSGNDTLSGGDGVDRLIGGSGNDVLLGDADKDVLVGGGGHDTMNGGSGADTFRFEEFNTGADTIIGFAKNQDRFDLGGGTFSARAEANGNTTLTHSGGTIYVTGVAGLSLAEWNALILPAGGVTSMLASETPATMRHTVGVDLVALVARIQLDMFNLGHGEWLLA